MRTRIENGTIITEGCRIANSVVCIENGIIKDIVSKPNGEIFGGVVLDAQGMFILPGFIDIHFHGAMGKDIMDADVASLEVMSYFCASHGVTSFYPTTWSASQADIMDALNCVKENQKIVKGARIQGVHVEGPYVDFEYRGAQLPSMIRKADKKEYQSWFDTGVVKIVTCAPEIDGAKEFISEAVSNGIRISIGHSQANYEQVFDASALGATQATHLFNGMVGLHHRDPGTVGGILDDPRLLVQVICDGVHLHPAIIRLIRAVKGSSKVILITDSIRGAGLPDGDYEHKGQNFFVRDGIARTPEGGLSGSTLTLDQAVRNYMRFTGASLEETVSTITSVPALEMGLENHKGRIAVGYDADLVWLSQDYEVTKTFVMGEIIFSKE